jgi:hypothetical protein
MVFSRVDYFHIPNTTSKMMHRTITKMTPPTNFQTSADE